MTRLSSAHFFVEVASDARDSWSTRRGVHWMQSSTVANSLSGFVQDTALHPVANVRIEIVDGQRAGVTVVTNAFGRYELPGQLLKCDLEPIENPFGAMSPGSERNPGLTGISILVNIDIKSC